MSGEQRCQCPKSLAVDDEGFNMIILEGFLKRIREDLCPVDKAYNGEEALNKLLINSHR